MNELTLTELDMGLATPKILRASKPSIDYRGKRQITVRHPETQTLGNLYEETLTCLLSSVSCVTCRTEHIFLEPPVMENSAVYYHIEIYRIWSRIYSESELFLVLLFSSKAHEFPLLSPLHWAIWTWRKIGTYSSLAQIRIVCLKNLVKWLRQSFLKASQSQANSNVFHASVPLSPSDWLILVKLSYTCESASVSSSEKKNTDGNKNIHDHTIA